MIKKILNALEYLFVISSLILYTGGILNVVALGGVSEGDANYTQATADADGFIIAKILYPLTYALALFFLIRVTKRFDRIPGIFLKNPYNLLLVLLTLASVVWSELPEFTLARSIALAGTTVFGIYLANRYTVKELLVLFSHAFFAIALLSILFAIVLPDYGIMGAIHAGAWRGIYAHKNQLGRLMVLAAIIFIIQPKRGSKKMLSLPSAGMVRFEANRPLEIESNGVLFNFIGLSLSIFLMVMTKSSGAIANFAILAVVLATFKISQLNSHQKFFAILGSIASAGIIAVLVVPNPELLFASIGKSSDLTGRGDLWNILLDMVSKSPLVGFGYGVFWLKYRTVLGLENGGWAAPDAHNGFLDLTLSVGVLGLALFALGYLYSFFTALARFRYTRNDEDLCPPVLLAYVVVSNMSETGLFAYNDIFWLLYITVSYVAIVRGAKPILALPGASGKPVYALPPAKDDGQKYLSPGQDPTTFEVSGEGANSRRETLSRTPH
jgi:exopolysaccharide production protein ExoQ